MSDLVLAAWPWLKALHIIAIISWMAGLLYLPRLFVYHCAVEAGSEASETFKIMEGRLYGVIMKPAMLASLFFGLIMLGAPGYLASAGIWLWAKLLLAGGMLVMHALMGVWKNDFAAGTNTRPQRFYRIVNEVPTLLMICIVILVVVKPF